jgi:hypothetical protein
MNNKRVKLGQGEFNVKRFLVEGQHLCLHFQGKFSLRDDVLCTYFYLEKQTVELLKKIY